MGNTVIEKTNRTKTEFTKPPLSDEVDQHDGFGERSFGDKKHDRLVDAVVCHQQLIKVFLDTITIINSILIPY